MQRWIFFAVIISAPILILNLVDFQENRLYTVAEFGKVPIVEVGMDFVRKASNEKENQTVDENILGTFRELTEEEILKATKIPNLTKSEEILNNGNRLSTSYHHANYEYSSGKIVDVDYLGKLFDFRIKYEKHFDTIDAYIGHDDVLTQKHIMEKELDDIDKQITLIRKSGKIEEGWESISEIDKFKKFLPSMFDS